VRRTLHRLMEMLGNLVIDPVRMHAVRRENQQTINESFAVEPGDFVDTAFGFAESLFPVIREELALAESLEVAELMRQRVRGKLEGLA